MNPLIAQLKSKLPSWYFEAYGWQGAAVACYPPGGPSFDRWQELAAVAWIGAVCGPLYIVDSLRTSSPVSTFQPTPLGGSQYSQETGDKLSTKTTPEAGV